MATTIKKLRFDDLHLESLVLEFRYPIAYLFWDFAGRVWQRIERALPDGEFDLENAGPGNVSAIYADRYQVQVGTQRASISCAHPKVEFSDFVPIAQTIYDIVIDKLEIESFNRIGFREVFVKKYASIDKVVAALQTLPSVSVPEAIREAFGSGAVGPGVTLRVEDDHKGTFFNLHGIGRRFDVKFPPLVADEKDSGPKVFDQAFLAMDIDSYTRSPVSVGQFGLKDWTIQAHQMAKRNAAHFF